MPNKHDAVSLGSISAWLREHAQDSMDRREADKCNEMAGFIDRLRSRTGASTLAAHASAQPAQPASVGAKWREDIGWLLGAVADDHGDEHTEEDCCICAAFNRLSAMLAGAPQPPSAMAQDARDAKRYRFLRDSQQELVDVYFANSRIPTGWNCWDAWEDKDACVDHYMQRNAAMAQESGE